MQPMRHLRLKNRIFSTWGKALASAFDASDLNSQSNQLWNLWILAINSFECSFPTHLRDQNPGTKFLASYYSNRWEENSLWKWQLELYQRTKWSIAIGKQHISIIVTNSPSFYCDGCRMEWANTVLLPWYLYTSGNPDSTFAKIKRLHK